MDDVEEILGYLSFAELSDPDICSSTTTGPLSHRSLSSSPPARTLTDRPDSMFALSVSPRENPLESSAAEGRASRSVPCRLRSRRGTPLGNLLQITVPLERVESQLSCARSVVYTSLREALEHAATGSLSFDSFQLVRLADERPLSALAMYLFEHRELVREFSLDEHKLRNFLLRVEDLMADHPYHNRQHISDVLQVLHGDTLPGGGLHELCSEDPIYLLAVLLAAIVHDVDHPGVNNDFLIKSGSPLVERHCPPGEAPQGVAELHHVATALELLCNEDCNFLEHFTAEQWTVVWGMIREMVLNTDMKRHMPFLSEVKAWLGDADAKSHKDYKEMGKVKAALQASFAMKCADLGHTVRPSTIHLRWAKAVTTEFYQQGDKEVKLGLPVTMGMYQPEDEAEVFESQALFLEHHVLPLFEDWAKFSESSRGAEMVTKLKDNIHHWHSLALAERAVDAPPSPHTTMLLHRLRDRSRTRLTTGSSTRRAHSAHLTGGRWTIPNADCRISDDNALPSSPMLPGEDRRLSSSLFPRFTSTMLDIPHNEFLKQLTVKRVGFDISDSAARSISAPLSRKSPLGQLSPSRHSPPSLLSLESLREESGSSGGDQQAEQQQKVAMEQASELELDLLEGVSSWLPHAHADDTPLAPDSPFSPRNIMQQGTW